MALTHIDHIAIAGHEDDRDPNAGSCQFELKV
jgi:hypothetical protein